METHRKNVHSAEGLTAGSRQRGLASLTAQHVVVGVVCDGVDVRRRLRAPLALVGGDHGGRVDGQPLVGVDGHTEEARVGLERQEVASQEPNVWTSLGQAA